MEPLNNNQLSSCTGGSFIGGACLTVGAVDGYFAVAGAAAYLGLIPAFTMGGPLLVGLAVATAGCAAYSFASQP